MSSSWNHYPAGLPDGPREFLVTVELYVSNAAGASLRKPQPKSKKLDKRESIGEDLRLKEKSSSNWLNLQKGLSGAGHWRTATCRLSEDEGRCLLNVYVDESILYQTVYVHLLNQTDIRQTDPSLFYKKDCLGIFSIAGQRWTPSQTAAEPLYLVFSNADTFATWQALLKSYAIPEIYGRWFFPMDGGSYRMWRQVELTVIQGRNMGTSKSDSGPGKDDKDDGDGAEVDISCEIHLNEILCSRTTVQRGLGSPDWHEAFTFPGLPPFEHLEISVWRDKKLSKPSILGTTRIALGNFRRGDHVEGWYPVVQPGAIGTEIQVGELRLKIRVDEEIILPYSSYKRLIQTYNSRNFLDWTSDLENRLKLKDVSDHLMSIAIANNSIIKHVQEYAQREVGHLTNSHQTLFRGNSTLTKVMELCMKRYGKTFLELSIGVIIRRICAEKVAIEVDPMRSGKGTRDVEKNMEQLRHWCQEFWKQIYSVRTQCPNEMRLLFMTLRKVVEQRYCQTDPTSIEDHSNLPSQGVSAFVFLRFIVPAILHPHLFGLYAGLPPLPIQRSLTLIAKVIQNMANLNANTQKESFMRGMQDFVKESTPAMIDYIVVVSTPLSEAPSSTNHPGDDMNRHDRINVANALRQRTKGMTVLDREAVPILPHLLDVPKHLAIITSAVIRSSRDLSARPRTGDAIDNVVDDFCSRCFEVEEDALSRVSQLATRLATESRRPSVPDISMAQDNEIPHSPLATVTSTVISTQPPVSRRRKSSRPSTAPSQSGSDSATSRRQMFFGENPLTSPRAFARTVQAEQERSWNRLGHTKAPSTDGFPTILHDVKPQLLVRSRLVDSSAEKEDETRKQKKGILRGILRR